MRIDPKVVVPISVGEAREQASATAAKPTKSESSTIVDISEAAQAASDPHDPKVTQRIAEIKGLLLAGAYPVDLQKLASRIVDDELLRGGPP